jgi:hypothetical protein
MLNNSHTGTSFGIRITKKQVDIAFFYCIIFGTVGLVANVIGILVFKRKAFANKAIGIYNIIIANVNNCVIIISLISYSPLYFNQNPLLWSSASCKILHFLQHTFTVLSSLLDMMITFDRMIRISFPSKFMALKKQSNVIFITLCFLFLSIGLNSFCFKYKIQDTSFIDTSFDNQTTESIMPSCMLDYSLLLSLNIITIIIRIILPFTVMIVSDIILIYKLKKEKGERYSKKEKSFSHSVLALSILFLITHLPFGILLIYQTILEFGDSNYRTNFTVSLLYEFSLVIASYNYVFPTLVNLIFNKLFRQEFNTLFRLGKKKNLDSTSG